MGNRDIRFDLKIDSKSGQAAIKKISTEIKALGTSAAALGTGIGVGAKAGTSSMLLMGAATGKAVSVMIKLTKAQAMGLPIMGEYIDKALRMAKAELEYNKAIHKGTAFSEKKLKNLKMLSKEYVNYSNATNKATSDTNKRTAAMEKQVTTQKRQAKGIKSFKQLLFGLRSYWLAVTAAVAVATITVGKFFKAGFMSVEKFSLSVASMAAAITNFSDLSGDADIASVYNNAYKYSEKLALKMEVINTRTIATGGQLRAMSETFIHHGVLLDVNNKKQEDSFVAIANAISLITQGQNQEIQMRQEVRGLLTGDIRATNLLAKMINTKLGGELKKNLNLWREQGTVIENLGKYLEGFKSGSADLASTWAAVSTSFDTIANRYLRGVFQPIYADIIKLSLGFSRSLLTQRDTLGDSGLILRDMIVTAWETIKNLGSTVKNLWSLMGPALAVLLTAVNKIVSGWSLMLKYSSAVVAKIAEGVKKAKDMPSFDEYKKGEDRMRTALEENAKRKERIVEIDKKILALEEKRERMYRNETMVEKQNILIAGLEKEKKLLQEMTDKSTTTAGIGKDGSKPDLKHTAEEEAFLQQLNTLDREYQIEKIKQGYDGFEEEKKVLEKRTAFAIADNIGKADIIEYIHKIHSQKMAQISAKHTAQEAAIRKRNHEDAVAYLRTDLENTLVALEAKKKAMIEAHPEKAQEITTKIDIEKGEAITEDETRRTAAARKEAAKILSIEQQTQRNLIRIKYDGYEEAHKLLQNELSNIDAQDNEREALVALHNTKVTTLYQKMINDILKEIKRLEDEGLTDAAEEMKKDLATYTKDTDLSGEVKTPDAKIKGLADLADKSKETTDQIIEDHKKVTKATKDAAEEINKMWDNVLGRIEANFADVFGSALRGELNSFQDFFKGFMDTIQQFAAEGLAEMIKAWAEAMAKIADNNKDIGGQKSTWTSENTLVAGVGAGAAVVSGATQDSSNAQAYSGAASGAVAGALIGAKYGTSAGWIGAVVGAVVGGLVGLLSGGDDDSDKIAEENAKRLREAINAMVLALEQSNKTLDAQLEATHSWSASISSVVKSYDENVANIYETMRITRETDEYQWAAPEIAAEVIFAKELALIAQSITQSMEDFELSIAKLTMTTYDASMADLEAYYTDVELAITEMDTYKISLNESLAGYQAQADEASLLFQKYTEEWSLYADQEAAIVEGKTEAYYPGSSSETYALPSTEEYLVMERYDDNLKAIDEIGGVMGDIASLAGDLTESYEESLAALEEYYLEQRELILSDSQKQIDGLSGVIDEMTGALESIEGVYKSWADELEDLGGTAEEIAELQSDWLKALTLVAASEIFDKFDVIGDELDLLSFQTEGGTTADYYFDKFEEATRAGNYISASEYLNAWYDAQREVATLWESVAENIEALVDNIQQVIDSIKYSTLNVAVPTEKAEEAEKDYAELKAAAEAGGTEEIEEFVTFASTYLQLAQDTLKSSDEYQSLYASVMADLVDVQEMAEAGNYDQLIYDELSGMNEELNENLLQVGVDLGQHIEALKAVFVANFRPGEYASFSGGGIATGPTAGYLAELHGTEAVIPMKNGSIDVRTNETPTNINVYIGNEQLDTHIVKQADQVRVKANRRPGNATQRLF